MASKKRRRSKPDAAMRDLADQLIALKSMTVTELQARHREQFGVPTRSRNKQFLVKRIAWRMQEQAEGGLSAKAKARAEELAPQAPARHNRPPSAAAAPERDPRLPPAGTVLTRRHDGKDHHVTVLAEGFDYRGTRYASLSKVALEITGTVWNGLLFFGLKKRGKRGGDA